MTDLQDSVEMPPVFPKSLSEIDISTSLHTTESPILTTSAMPDRGTHMSPSQFSIELLKELTGLTNMSEDKEMEG